MFRAPYPRVTYPLSAVVGVDDMRLALLLDAVSPAAGGVLMRGEEGTAKSTTVRPLAAPDVACTDGPYEPTAGGPVRLVELAVGASVSR